MAEAAGEVLISDAVYRKVEGGQKVERSETVELKRRWRFSAKARPRG